MQAVTSAAFATDTTTGQTPVMHEEATQWAENPTTRAARAFAAALPVAHVVLAPGSRSAPLALAFADLEAQGRLTLHVRIDERSAGFLALGLARSTGRPVAVLCTSGTAVANLAPAALEAHEDDVPLLLLTADRPAEVRGHGANQAVDHIGLLARGITCFDIDAPDASTDEDGWADIARGVHERAATESRPVQVNLQFATPLVPQERL
jgi:2-succinyl-5-enolpyruvyl-6-hydroxy-3-cyclohexene-1-carboxylate synthase